MPTAGQQRVAVMEEVPSPIDLRRMSDARNWEQSANLKRPWRTDFFDAFSVAIRKHPGDVHRILELGSGPGFLAEHIFLQGINADYTALDFSNAMHALAKARLGPTASRVHFRTRSFVARAGGAGSGISTSC